MEVVKIKAGGFCAGVRLAIEKARAAVSKRGKAYAFCYGVHDGFGTVRSILRKKNGREYVVCPLKDIERYAVSGSTDPLEMSK